PHGVSWPSGGPGESTSGNVGFPLKRIVRVRLNEVVAARAAPATHTIKPLVTTTAASVIPIRLPTDDTFVPSPPEASLGQGIRASMRLLQAFTGCLPRSAEPGLCARGYLHHEKHRVEDDEEGAGGPAGAV